MAEIKQPLIKLPGGAYFITENHTHSDILRFVVDDLGVDEAMFLLEQMKKEQD